MERAATLSLTEAGYVLDCSPRAINKAVDDKVIRATVRRRRGVPQRLLGPAELRYLRLEGKLHRHLTPTGRRKLYEAVQRLPTGSHTVPFGDVPLDLTPIDRELDERLRRLEQIKAQVHQPPGAHEPLLRGTRVPVHAIAGLARGQTVEQILQDYPSLSRPQVEAAIEYARAYPKRGRPYPAKSLKRLLADLDLDGAEPVRANRGPRRVPAR
jgi:uncharacterized protein (DUF433 family)